MNEIKQNPILSMLNDIDNVCKYGLGIDDHNINDTEDHL